MSRFENLFLGLLGFAGTIASLIFVIHGLRPCSGDGCFVRLELIAGIAGFVIAAPVCYLSLRRELLRRKKNDSGS